MNRIDRYIIAQIVGPFGFFALVFTGVIWLTQSLRVIDTVVNAGQTAGVFLAFTALLLPVVMSIVLPVAAFAATLYLVNRLYSESELVVMMGAGISTLRLARPIAIFGAAVMVAMCVITLYLMPTAARELRERIADIRSEIANALIREGEFVHPGDGLTIYIRETNRAGEMAGIFLHDNSDPAEPVTYTAERAALVREDGAPRVVMFSGAAQHYDVTRGSLSILDFETLVYDLSPFIADDETRARKPSEHYVGTLVNPPEELWEGARRTRGDFTAEGHEQLSAPLYGLTLPLLALALVVFGGFRRRGFAIRIAFAIVGAVVIRVLGIVAKSAATSVSELWPLMYVPPILGLIIAVVLLSGRRRAAPFPAAAEGAVP
ncbi:MAG: LPS export ABC transporter permease LptF [Pseudomonadota bacterium]